MSDSCNHVDYSLPGSSVHEILQLRILKRVAISFSRGSSLLGIKPVSPAWQVDSLPLSHLGGPINMLTPPYNAKGAIVYSVYSFSCASEEMVKALL